MKNNKKKEAPAMKRISTVGLVPLGDRVLLKLADGSGDEKSNKFGIIIPETVNKEKPEQGKVVAIGDGRRGEAGNLVPMSVKIGDTVVFSKYNYDEVKHNNQEYVMVKEENILAVIR